MRIEEDGLEWKWLVSRRSEQGRRKKGGEEDREFRLHLIGIKTVPKEDSKFLAESFRAVRIS